MQPPPSTASWAPWVGLFASDGSPIWAKGFGFTSWLDFTGMTALTTQFWLGGWYSGSLSLAPPPQTSALNDPFVALVSADGAAAKQMVWSGPGDLDFITAVTAASDGGVFVVGYAQDGFAIDATVVNDAHASFVARLAPDGTVAWANIYQAPSLQSLEAVALQGDKLIAVGLVSYPIDFGGGMVAVGMNGDPLVLTLSAADGSHLASASFPGPGGETARAVAFAPDGSYVVAMHFQQSMSIGGRDHVGQGNEDLLFVGFAADGTINWSEAYGGGGAEYLNEMAIGPSGNIHFVATYNAPFDLGNITLPHVGSVDAVAAKLGPTGEPLWAQTLVGPAGDNLRTLAVDVDDSTLVAGWFSSPGASFGGSALGSGPMLIARLAP